jgi:hypothetical protein
MFEVQMCDRSESGGKMFYVSLFETLNLAEAQFFYHQYRRDQPDISIRLIEVLRRS